MTHISRGDADLHYPNGEHRGTPQTTDGRELEVYERRIHAHLWNHAHSRRADLTTEDAFPLDWREWRALWSEYLSLQLAAGTFKRTSYRIAQAKSIAADEVLGTWNINGQNVELSEVRFPDFVSGSGKSERVIGITVAGPGGTRGLVDIAHSFAELERLLRLSIHVGDVAVIRGEPNDGNPYRGGSISGPERASALRAFRDGKESDFYTYWYAPASGGAYRLTNPASVDWQRGMRD